MTTLGREKRAHEFQKIWDELKLSDFPIVVEGKRDTKALRELGIVKHVIELNDGTSVLSTVERIFQNSADNLDILYFFLRYYKKRFLEMKQRYKYLNNLLYKLIV